MLAELAPGQRGQVQVDVEPEVVADIDVLAFERIVANLVVNGLRHGAPPVTVSAWNDQVGLRLVVEDSGEGVPEDVRGRLFEQFARSSRAAGTPGSGLGLAIARSYAQAHGGDLVLDENGTGGARFHLVLPAARG
jgi:two-component system sensor histidine kinase MtrB